MAGSFIGKRSAALALALVLAGGATVALFGYVRGLERSVFAQAEPMPVFVASDLIPAGTTAAVAVDSLITRQNIPRRAVVEGAITALDQIRGKVAGADILPGEQIVGSRFQQQVHEPVLDIPEGHQAMSVELGSPPSVGGHVKSKDHVSIITRVKTGPAETDVLVKYLLQDVEVLAVGLHSDDEKKDRGAVGTGDQGRIMLTLAVTPAEAEQLAFAAMGTDALYFTLLPSGQQPQTTTGRSVGNLFS